MLDDDLIASLDWSRARSVQEAMDEREAIMARIERQAATLRRQGACRHWLKEVDDIVWTVSIGVHGPLLAALAKEAVYHDAACVDLFKSGGPLVGPLVRSGNGGDVAHQSSDSIPTDVLRAERFKRNHSILDGLREDRKHSFDLLEMCRKDAELGRMSMPKPISYFGLSEATFSPRFCIEQGTRPDGSPKLRAVDDFSVSGCNAAAVASERLKTDSLDAYLELLQSLYAHSGSDISMWKADIDSAYRRVPVAPEHRDFGWVAFKHHDAIYASQHYCLPFGSMPSVHHWDRVGSLLRALARRVLFLPVLRFVDDFYAACRSAEVEHAMQIFARLVRCLFGADSIAAHKLEFGNPLTVLGVAISLKASGIRFRPEPCKLIKWAAIIKHALDTNKLCAGAASKLAGRLMWACQHAFKRIGRAMLYPIFKQQRNRCGSIDIELRLALEWWLEVLSLELCEAMPWQQQITKPMHMLCDARSTPPRVAAVLLANKRVYYSDMEPSEAVMSNFRIRGDNQIMSLELLSIAFGLSVFEDIVRGNCLHVHSDNTGAQHCTARGMARSFDHTCLVHGIWMRAAELNTGQFPFFIACER